MIRLVLILCGCLLLTFFVAGGENGQRRLGLTQSAQALQPRMAAPNNAASLSDARADPTPAPALPAAQNNAALIVASTAGQQRIGDVKFVQGRTVNIRSGPSVDDAVVGKLRRGEAVSILWVEDNGWARIRMEGDGIDGFMSMDFLGDRAP